MILVTGAKGYLGGHVLRLLKERGVRCSGERCDLLNREAVRGMLNRLEPTRIIHCAAIVPKTPADYQDTAAAAASVTMTRNLANYARCPITLASSMTADYRGWGYARGKWMAEMLMGVVRGTSLRLPGLFGPPRRGGVLYNAARAFLAGETFELTTVPSSWAAMDVRDAAECMIANEYTGPTEPMDIRAAVALVRHLCGSGEAPDFDPRFVQRVAELVKWAQSEMVAA